MSRERVWHTQRELTGQTSTVFPRWLRLVPDDVPSGTTVVRTMVSVQVSALHDSTTETPRPVLINAGLIYGPEPHGTEFDPTEINTHDWMWIGSQTTTAATFQTSVIYWLPADGQVAFFDSRAARRIEGSASTWLLLTAELTSARTFNSSQVITRTLYLLPAA